jgi:hypothetical protein
MMGCSFKGERAINAKKLISEKRREESFATDGVTAAGYGTSAAKTGSRLKGA